MPAGLGDCLWIFQKLIHTGEKFHIVSPGGSPRRSHQLAELLPNIIESHSYAPEYGEERLSYKKINRENIYNGLKTWRKIQDKAGDKFYLSVNAWLENGNRIDRFLSDLPTSYKLEFTTQQSDKDKAAELLPAGPKYIGIYTSAYSNSRHWNGWLAKEWSEFISMVHGVDSSISFVIVGAPYDLGIPDELVEYMTENQIDHINTVGEQLTVVIELMKRFNYFLGFPSGLSIINELLGKDGLMFYPENLTKLINTWADPKRIAEGNYKGCLFCEPKKIIDWLSNDYKLFDKL